MRRPITKKPWGFTLLELLVVVAIIGLLIALLLPPVQKVREAANRVTCANNLKQLGLALHNYENTNGSFPPSNTGSPQKRHAWVAFILPYIEQQPLFNQYKSSANWNARPNRPAVSTPLKVFQCPSTPVPDRVDDHLRSKPACGDYNVTPGVSRDLVTLGLVPPTPDLRGVMVKNQATRVTDVTDGTANTIVAAEDAGRPDLWNAGRLVPGGYANGGGWADTRGPFFLNGASADGSVSPGPCPINCTNDNEIYSFHPAGANVLFTDGHVLFLTANTNISIVAALITRAGAEVIPNDLY
jgi:prepilin-type N-terminal cleavage/methylation domain-containing protein/prepilin-type processing-associated H-X9-DG protein